MFLNQTRVLNRVLPRKNSGFLHRGSYFSLVGCNYIFGRDRNVLEKNNSRKYFEQPAYEKITSQLKKEIFFDPQPNPGQIEELIKMFRKFLEHAEKAKGNEGKTPYYEIPQSKKKIEFDRNYSSSETAIKYVEDYFNGMSIRNHSGPVSGPVPPVTIPSVFSALMAAYYNPNLAWQELGSKLKIAEEETINKMIHLLGYNPSTARGFFSFGGTATNMYAIKLASCRTAPEIRRKGRREEVKIITCELSMYAKAHVINWLGLGSDSLILVPPKDKKMEIDYEVLAEKSRSILESNSKLGGIMLNCGTIDCFSFDSVEKVVRLRDDLVKEFNLDYIPLVHVDASLGWAWSAFNHYDFEKNPLEFERSLLLDAQEIASFTKQLSMADSIGVDFHKSGFAPLSSSMFLVKNESFLNALKRTPEEMPFFETSHLPGIFTLESSRSAVGVLSALANIKSLGLDGFQSILAHTMRLANDFKQKLSKRDDCIILNPNNPGPLVVFRMYPDKERKLMYEAEVKDPQMKLELNRANNFNRILLRSLQKREGISLAKHERFITTDYGENLLTLKIFFLSPFCDQKTVDSLIDSINNAHKETVETISQAMLGGV